MSMKARLKKLDDFAKATCLTPEVSGMVKWLGELDRDATALTAKAVSGVLHIGQALESVAKQQFLSKHDIDEIRSEIRILRNAHLGLNGEISIVAERINEVFELV
jgi:hypothetical protein